MTRRWVGVLLLAAFILFLLTACGPNYSGEGNEFELRATLASVGHRSVTVREFAVLDAHGKATNWFDQGGHQIHNNYTQGLHRHTIGHVYGADRTEISLRDLRSGMRVLIFGRIRSSKEGKYDHYRPVYDSIEVQK